MGFRGHFRHENFRYPRWRKWFSVRKFLRRHFEMTVIYHIETNTELLRSFRKDSRYIISKRSWSLSLISKRKSYIISKRQTGYFFSRVFAYWIWSGFNRQTLGTRRRRAKDSLLSKYHFDEIVIVHFERSEGAVAPFDETVIYHFKEIIISKLLISKG